METKKFKSYYGDSNINTPLNFAIYQQTAPHIFILEIVDFESCETLTQIIFSANDIKEFIEYLEEYHLQRDLEGLRIDPLIFNDLYFNGRNAYYISHQIN